MPIGGPLIGNQTTKIHSDDEDIPVDIDFDVYEPKTPPKSPTVESAVMSGKYTPKDIKKQLF